ncbi:dienelactone hydrolase family protein [Streptomyces olivoreticuli]
MPVREHRRIRLRAADGNRVPAYRAIPAAATRGSIILLPDVRGLHPYYEDLTLRFAEAGYTALAIDLYGRTAPGNAREDAFRWHEHLPLVQPDGIDIDARAAAEHLRSLGSGPLFTVGFCYGGGHSWRLAGSSLPLAGAIGFYGLPHLVGDVLGGARAPMLMLLAEHDDETPRSDYDRLTTRLDAAHAPYEAHVHPGTPHSFFDRSHDQWGGACADAWHRILDFTDRAGTWPARDRRPTRGGNTGADP